MARRRFVEGEHLAALRSVERSTPPALVKIPSKELRLAFS